MRTESEIRSELDRATRRRAELWEELSRGRDPAASAEAASLSAEIDELWAELRAVQARERWGPVERIHARARAEERLEREARRLRDAA